MGPPVSAWTLAALPACPLTYRTRAAQLTCQPALHPTPHTPPCPPPLAIPMLPGSATCRAPLPGEKEPRPDQQGEGGGGLGTHSIVLHTGQPAWTSRCHSLPPGAVPSASRSAFSLAIPVSFRPPPLCDYPTLPPEP